MVELFKDLEFYSMTELEEERRRIAAEAAEDNEDFIAVERSYPGCGKYIVDELLGQGLADDRYDLQYNLSVPAGGDIVVDGSVELWNRVMGADTVFKDGRLSDCIKWCPVHSGAAVRYYVDGDAFKADYLYPDGRASVEFKVRTPRGTRPLGRQVLVAVGAA